MEEKINLEKNIQLAKENIQNSIYYLSKLAGIDMTFDEIVDELNNNNFVYSSDIKEKTIIKNINNTWNYILETILDSPSEKNLIEINRILTKGVVEQDTVIRLGRITVEGTENYRPDAISENELARALYEYLKAEEPIDRAIFVFVWICRNCPFWALNVLTAFLFANKILIANSKGILYLCKENFEDFKDILFRLYETSDEEEIIEYLYSNCIVTK